MDSKKYFAYFNYGFHGTEFLVFEDIKSLRDRIDLEVSGGLKISDIIVIEGVKLVVEPVEIVKTVSIRK